MNTTCDHPSCASILSRLANTVRARLAYDDHPGYSDAVLGVQEGILDFADGAAFAGRAGLAESAFLHYTQSKKYTLGNTKFIWKELRQLIFERDKGCIKCRGGYNQVHHIVGVAMGGDLIAPCNLEALCRNCHNSSHRGRPKVPRQNKGVSTQKVRGDSVGNILLRASEPVSNLSPLRRHPPNRHVLFDRWIEIRGLLVRFLHGDPAGCQGADKWKRVEMVMEALRLQATAGKCFASASHLASHVGANRKTWDRTLVRMRSLSLVSTERLCKENGTQSTNLADFSSLWALVLTILQERYPTFDRLSDGLWVKLKGLWKHFEDLLEEVLSSSLPPPGVRLRSPLHEGWVDYGQQQQRTY